MCGIAAIIYGDIERLREARFFHALKHRGPDHTGQWSSSSAPVWLGHHRLSIVDLSPTGCQPMYNEDKTIWLVCNGEIYNYPDLREYLESLGHHFYSTSDSEVIIHAYETWGEQLVHHLEGMFAFVLWDDKRQQLLAARDPVGMKPLYYSELGEGLLLASEAGALLPLLEDGADPEPMALAYVMTLGYVPSPWSIWKRIFKIEPGCMVIWEREKGMQHRRYWEPPRHLEVDRTYNVQEWTALFETALQEHLLADVPIGLFLSGGLDSSTIATGLHEIGRPVPAVTVSFPGGTYDEAPTAASLAEHLGFPHTIIALTPTDVNTLIHDVAAAFDEPQGYSALLSMFLISREAARDFKVVLSGDGGDELFGGYTWYQNLNGGVSSYSRWIRQALRPVLRRNAPPRIRRQACRHFAKSSVLHRHAWRLYPRFLPEEAEALLAPMGVRFGDEEMLAPLRKHFEPSLPLQRALQRVDLMTFCSDSILAKVDRASMSHGLEIRVPFLDRRIIDWSLAQSFQPNELGVSKPLLREYLRTRNIPSEILQHPKQGFSLPVLDDFNWDAAVDQVREGLWVRQGYWSSDWERLVEPGVPYREARIWNFLILTLWGDNWLGPKYSVHL
jgi:asparagine synthase (glutamine-hydrolysing)